MPVPEKVPIEHYRGDTLTVQVKLWDDIGRTKPTSLTGAAVLAQVRSNPASTDVIATFTTAISGNQITLTMAPAVTALLPEKATYDVQVTYTGGVVQTVLAGPLTADQDVSHP